MIQLDSLIEKLIERSNHPKLYPGERGYHSLAARLITKEINQWLKEHGINKKVSFYTTRAWINRNCPHWVLIGLSQRLR